MRDVHAELGQALEQRGRRRRAAGADAHRPRQLVLAAAGSQIVIVSTVGAAQKWVTPDSRMCRQIALGSSLSAGTGARRRSAVTAHGKHQPLQWNIGSVQR